MQCSVTTTIRLKGVPSRDFDRDRPSSAIMAMLESDADAAVSVKPSTRRVFEGLRFLQFMGKSLSLTGGELTPSQAARGGGSAARTM